MHDTFEQIKYKIVHNGKVITAPTDRWLAELSLKNLPSPLREQAQMVPVNGEGKEVLFG